MSTYTEIEDSTFGNVRPLHLFVPLIAIPIVLILLGSGENTPYFGALAGLAVGVLARGIKETRKGPDGTGLYRKWVRPFWLRIAVLAVFATLAVVSTAFMAGEHASLREWAVSALWWIGGIAALSRYVMMADTRRRVPNTAKMTPENAALSRVSNEHFATAGLSIRSKLTGGEVLPEIFDLGLDDKGRPYYVANLLAGHQTLDGWKKAGPRLASAWGVPRVVVTGGDDVTQVRVTAHVREFVRKEPVRWCALYDPDQLPDVVTYLSRVPMGEHADSPEVWYQNFVEANITAGGIQGAGKSNYISSLLGELALHPHIDIGFIDLKRGVEAAPWERRLSAVARTREEAVELIIWVLGDCNARYDRMRGKTRNAWQRGFLGESEPVKVIIIDESAVVLVGATREERRLADVAVEKLRELVSIGRAAGYIVVLATQKPTVDTLPSSIRDITSHRVAFACMSDMAAVAILGSEWQHTPDAETPLTITKEQRGMAVVGSDTGEYLRVQTGRIEDEEIDAIVDMTAKYRRPWNWTASADPGADAGAGSSWDV